jgi:hypothetical protein
MKHLVLFFRSITGNLGDKKSENFQAFPSNFDNATVSRAKSLVKPTMTDCLSMPIRSKMSHWCSRPTDNGVKKI